MPASAPDDTPPVSGRRFAFVGAVSFVVFIIMLFPARLAWQWQEALVPLLSLSGIEGTVWDANATGAFLAGVPLGAASLSWRPMALLRGEWRNRVRLEASDGEAQGDFGWTLTGATVATDVSLRTSLSQVMRHYPGGASALPVQLDGGVGLVLESLVYRDGSLERLAGALHFGEVTVAENNVGSLVAELRDHEGGIVADFHSVGDPSPGIDGTAAWRPSGDYRLRLGVADPDMLGDEVAGLIKGLARRSRDGTWQIEWEGRL